MQKSVRKRIGNEVHTFIIEGKTLFDVMKEESKLSFDDVDRCGLCGSQDLKLSCHTTKEEGHEYVHVNCKNPNCRARLNFGQQKKDSSVFYLKTKQDQNGNSVYDWQQFKRD